MNIYFHIDELNRDAIVAKKLSGLKNKYGWNIVFGNRQLNKILKKYASIFDVIILPKPHFIKAIFGDEVTKIQNRKFMMLYTENIGIIANEANKKLLLKAVLDSEFMSGDTKYVDKVSAFCFWGPRVKDIVVDHYPDLKERSFVIGHPRHQNFYSENRLQILSKNNIGIVTRFNTLNDYLIRHPLEIIKNRVYLGEILEFNNLQTGDVLKFERRGSDIPGDILTEAMDFQTLVEITRQLLLDNFKVSWKIHPRENHTTYKKIFKSELSLVKIADQKIPFTEWGQMQKYVIGPPSTSFYDSYLLGTLPVSIAKIDARRTQFIKPLYEENNSLMQHIFEPLSIEELINFIKQTDRENYLKRINDQKVLKVLNQEVNYPDFNTSLEKIEEIIQKIVPKEKSSITKKIKLTKFKFYSYAQSEILSVAYFIIKKFSQKGTVNSSNFFLNHANRKFIKSS